MIDTIFVFIFEGKKMTITVQQGTSATIKLKFLNVDGSAALPPTSGGSVSTTGIAGLSQNGHAVLGSDQQTITYSAGGLGVDTISYVGPQGLTASENVVLVATTANAVVFDESTFTIIATH